MGQVTAKHPFATCQAGSSWPRNLPEKKLALYPERRQNMTMERKQRQQMHAFDTPDVVYRHTAERIVESINTTLSRQPQCSLALGGGSTPQRLYEMLSTKYATRVDWSRVLFFWGDERAVPPTHADSNFRMAKNSLLDPLDISSRQIHRMEGERANLAEAARDYEDRLRATLSGAPPVVDLVLLGMGADGHTASLFPGTEALEETERLVVANHVPQLSADRLTMTFPLLNAASHIMFVVIGEAKAAALAAVMEGPTHVRQLPSQGVTGAEVIEWWLDAAAASQLSTDH